MKTPIFLLLLLTAQIVWAQNKMVDSLRHWLATHPQQDSTRVVNLHRLSYRLSEIDQTSSWRYANEAHQLAKLLHNDTNIGQSYINYAILEALEGNYPKAQEYYLTALKLFEKTGWQRGKAICLNNIAETYKTTNQQTKALAYTFAALELNKLENQRRGIAVNYEQIGELYRRMGKYQASIEYLQKGLEMAKEADQNYQILPQLLLGMGRNYRDRREFATAQKYFEESLLHSKRDNEQLLQIQGYTEMAFNYQLQHNYRQAQLFLEKGFDIARDYGSQVEMSKVSQQMADLAQLEGRFEDALHYFKSYQLLNQSIENKRNAVRNELVELKYEAFEKEKENNQLKQIKREQEAALRRQAGWIISLAILVIALLGLLGYAQYKSRIKQIKDAQLAQAETIRQLQLSEKIRTQIARDLHDDLGATLSSVAMLSQTARKMLSSDNDKLTQLLDLISTTSQRTVGTIRDIIWTTRPINNTLEALVNKMKIFANELLDPINIKCNFKVSADLANYKLPTSQQYNFYLIFKEAINNIAKYAQASTVDIKIYKSENRLHLVIKDDGIGFDKEVAKNNGNGLFNMEKRVEELEGELHIDSKPQQGTTINLVLPLVLIPS